jgi:molybdopterin/thiamine biosynthesis adenylyltransferase
MLGTKQVVFVGAGALGSHTILLARNWKARLTVIDFDRVETKNIQSQFHSELGKGKNKAKAIEGTLQGMFRRPIEALPVKLTKDNTGLLQHANLVIDCTDNYEARTLLQEYAKLTGTPCLHGCLSADGNLARIIWTENFTPDREDAEGQATCEDGANLAFHAMAGAVVAFVGDLFLRTGLKQSFQLTPSAIIRLT